GRSQVGAACGRDRHRLVRRRALDTRRARHPAGHRREHDRAGASVRQRAPGRAPRSVVAVAQGHGGSRRRRGAAPPQPRARRARPRPLGRRATPARSLRWPAVKLGQELKRLGRHSAIYGFGGLVSRILATLLLPLYTHYLPPRAYGRVEIVTATTAVAAIALQM